MVYKHSTSARNHGISSETRVRIFQPMFWLWYIQGMQAACCTNLWARYLVTGLIPNGLDTRGPHACSRTLLAFSAALSSALTHSQGARQPSLLSHWCACPPPPNGPIQESPILSHACPLPPSGPIQGSLHPVPCGGAASPSVLLFSLLPSLLSSQSPSPSLSQLG